MKDNPIFPLVRTTLKRYDRLVRTHSKRVENLLTKYNPTPGNQSKLRGWLWNIADSLTKDTERFLREEVEEVIDITLDTYNDRLNKRQLEELKIRIMKDFFLTKFVGKTTNTRLSQAGRRLKVNLQNGLQNLIQVEKIRSKDLKIITHSITGRDFIAGGSAYKWNGRLIMSECFRAYQFTAKILFEELGVAEVEWRNSPRHKSVTLIDDYEGKRYKPSDLPEYPYPCNDSYFIPIKED